MPKQSDYGALILLAREVERKSHGSMVESKNLRIAEAVLRRDNFAHAVLANSGAACIEKAYLCLAREICPLSFELERLRRMKAPIPGVMRAEEEKYLAEVAANKKRQAAEAATAEAAREAAQVKRRIEEAQRAKRIDLAVEAALTDAQAAKQSSAKPPPKGAEPEPPAEGAEPTDDNGKLGTLPKRVKLAHDQYLNVCDNAGLHDPTDRQVYDLLVVANTAASRLGRDEPYPKLRHFCTWVRYIREWRAAKGQSKSRSRGARIGDTMAGGAGSIASEADV